MNSSGKCSGLQLIPKEELAETFTVQKGTGMTMLWMGRMQPLRGLQMPKRGLQLTLGAEFSGTGCCPPACSQSQPAQQ